MVEILIVMALLAILAVGGGAAYSTYSLRARDSRRLSDLREMQTALAGYYEDNLNYPETGEVVCGSTILAPYVDEVPCDPIGNDDYQYIYDKENPRTYRIYVRLEAPTEEMLEASGCQSGCGPGSISNYYVASENVAVVGGGEGVDPTCGGAVKYCFVNVCGACCPGDNYRCNGSGTKCIVDTTCL